MPKGEKQRPVKLSELNEEGELCKCGHFKQHHASMTVNRVDYYTGCNHMGCDCSKFEPVEEEQDES